MRLICLVLFLLPAFVFAQIPYGDNPAAGHFCNTRGVKLYYEVYGAGKPLVLAHGNGGSIENFKGIIPFFARYYKVIAVDTRAHGKSADPGDSLSFEMIADDFNALLDSLHTGPVYFIGWSDGGIDGLAIAMRHPEKLKKMAITGANIFVDSTALPGNLIPEMKATTQKMHARTNLTAEEKSQLKYNDLDLYQPQWKPSDLDRITTPTLVIGGDHDLIPVPHTVLIWQHIPNAWLWIVPHSGHGTLIEHRDEFEQNVLAFFQAKEK
jgi:pimeloyl-ACP methyl ester carboxylesterase